MALTRSLLLGASGCVLAVLASQVFNGRASELVLVPVALTLTAILARRFGMWIQILATAGVTVASSLGVVVLVGGSVGDLAPGVVHGPRRLLSTEWPSPLDPSMVATLALLVGGCTSTALVLAMRDRWRLLPLLPILVGGTVLVALSAPERPSAWWFLALGVLAVCFALTDPTRPAPRRTAGLHVDRTVAATVIVVGAVTFLTAGAVAWADRADPRETSDPNASETLLDPIESTVAMRNTDPVIDLMTISDRSPLARPTMPSRWRLAAFDRYDGQRWSPSVELNPIGGVLGTIPDDDAAPLVYSVAYHGDWIDLVPFPGRPIAIDRDVQTDLERVAVRLTEPPTAATVVEAVAVPQPSFADAAGSTVTDRTVDEIAATFTDRARRLAGTGDAIEQLGQLASVMRTEWELDSLAPGAGLQQTLISRFVTDTQRGTREQFVTAFVLLARSIGFDARIASGFVVAPGDLGSTFALRTDQAAVWPEVRLTDGSWLAFDPVPESEVTDEVEDDPPPQAQSPAAPQPPVAPPADDETTDDDVVLDDETTDDGLAPIGVWAGRVAVSLLAVLTPIGVVIGAILAIKWHRRRSRLRASEPGARVRGAWANTTDSLVDAGLDIAPSWTDDHIALASSSVLAGGPHEARRLAAMSSSVTFGSRRDAEAARLADDASATSASVDDAIRTARTRWERVKWRLSLRSLRRSTRSPVTP